jgi:hypothetical protein
MRNFKDSTKDEILKISYHSFRYFDSKEDLNVSIKKQHEIICESTDKYGTYSLTVKNKKSGKYSCWTVRKNNSMYKFLDNSHKKFVY